MKCKDCKNFKEDKNLEIGGELTPNLMPVKGKCAVNDKNCKDVNSCGCERFDNK